MPRSRPVVVVLCLGLIGCDSRSGGAKAVDHAAAKTDAKPDAKTDESAGAAPAEPEAPAPGTPATPTKAELRADVDTTVALDGGIRLTIAAQAEQPKSTLWVERTASGSPPERFTLRTTTGQIEDLTAVWDGTNVWVAWRSAVPSKTGGDDRALVASAGYDATLASVGKAKILRSFDPAGELPEGSVVLRARSEGGATVAALAGSERCTSDVERREVTCPRMQVFVLGSSGQVVRTVSRALTGGDASVDALVDAKTGTAVAWHAYRGGPLTDVVFVPHDPATPEVGVSACLYPSIDLAFVDDTIVSMCPDPDSDNDAMLEAGCKGKPGSWCGMLGRADRTGTSVAPSTSRAPQVPIAGVKAACDGGQGVLELSWAKDGARAAGAIRVPTGRACT